MQEFLSQHGKSITQEPFLYVCQSRADFAAYTEELMLSFTQQFVLEIQNSVASVDILEADADSSTFMKFLKLVSKTKDFMCKLAPAILETIFRNNFDVGIDKSGLSDLLDKKLTDLRVSIENKYFAKLTTYIKGVISCLCLSAHSGTDVPDSDLKSLEVWIDALSKFKGRIIL